MAQENFNVSEPNDGLGDKLRAAFIIAENNFTDLYTNKVDKEAGKGLSSENYTTTEKNKLANIADFAEVNVQADFLQNDNTADDFIKNKPTIPVVDDYLLNGGYAGTAQDLADSVTLQQATAGANKNLVDGIFQAGEGAGNGQTGVNVNQFGGEAGAGNTANHQNAFGATSGELNEGLNQNAFGQEAGNRNKGVNQNAFGNSAGNNNEGVNQNAFGNSAGAGNTFNDVNLFGAVTQADEHGQTVFRSSGGFMTRLSTLLLTASRKYILPDKSGTFAMLDDTQILTAGTNITIVGDVISASGGGGGGSFVKLIVGDSVESAAVTGTLAEVIAKSYTIPAGAFSATLNPRFTFYAQKGTSTAGTFKTSIYLSNTNNFATAILTGFYTTTSGIIRGASVERITQRFIGANLFSKVSVQTLVSDNQVTANDGTTWAIDHTQIIYVWITLQNNNVADSSSIGIVKITD